MDLLQPDRQREEDRKKSETGSEMDDVKTSGDSVNQTNGVSHKAPNYESSGDESDSTSASEA